jgi:uncharacterized protein
VILFLDASAFIKLYVAEAGSGAMRRTVRNATAVYAVDLTYVEACAAFARAGQTGLLRTKHAEATKADFDRDWQCVNVVTPDAAMLRRAAELAGTNGVRASAGLNLAAAEAIQRQLSTAVGYRVGTGDPHVAQCVKRLGLPALDPGIQGPSAPA